MFYGLTIRQITTGHWGPHEQRDVIAYLVDNGADPNALDNSGVAPIHRAVRTRSSGAVTALIEHGGDPRLQNKSGSTPLHLAVQNTGKSGSGSDAAKTEQAQVIVVLLEHGASPTDTDANGKTVAAAASSQWVPTSSAPSDRHPRNSRAGRLDTGPICRSVRASFSLDRKT